MPLQSLDPFSLCSPMLHIIPQIVTSEFSASVSQVKALVAPAAGAGSGESDAALSAGQAKAAAILAAQLAAEALLPEAEVRSPYVSCCARWCLGGQCGSGVFSTGESETSCCGLDARSPLLNSCMLRVIVVAMHAFVTCGVLHGLLGVAAAQEGGGEAQAAGGGEGSQGREEGRWCQECRGGQDDPPGPWCGRGVSGMGVMIVVARVPCRV